MKAFLVATALLLVVAIQAASGGGGGEVAPTSGAAAKMAEKMAYPKKVTSLKKRPTKSPLPMPSTAPSLPAATSAPAATLTATTTAPLTKTTTTTSRSATKAALKRSKEKKGADVAAAFKDLPAEDLEFIKALDKQFKLHGGKVKIKVERDNSTGAGNTNSKRTIDGQLGYGAGYHSGGGYEYPRPKFEFYPYSQQDIPSSAPGYYPSYEKTSVTIEPSYSYELKAQTYEEHNEQPTVDLPPHQAGPDHDAHDEYREQQHHHQQPEPQYEEPVIVLRIPGPTKYASHLQTLLQQYLEIRAAQYLQILEQAELRKQPPHFDHYEQQPQHYASPAPAPSAAEEQHGDYGHQPQEVPYGHQLTATPQPIAYPAIDDVYQSYKGRHQALEQQHQQHRHQQQEQEQEQHVEQPQGGEYYDDAQAYHAVGHAPSGPEQGEQPQYYYMQEQPEYGHGQVQVQLQPPAEHAYQNVYFLAMAPQPVYEDDPQEEQHQQPIYVQEEGGDEHQQQAQQHEHHQQEQHQQEQQHHDGGEALPISENSPRTTHTKVIFTQHGEGQGADEYATRYPLPSIRPYERHAPTSAPAYHYQQQQQHHQQQQQHQDAAESGLEEAHQETVAITQRPYNYHAHGLMAAMRRGRKRGAAKAAPKSQAVEAEESQESDTADETDQHFDKIREYVRDKLGAKMGSTVEFKTTKVVSG